MGLQVETLSLLDWQILRLESTDIVQHGARQIRPLEAPLDNCQFERLYWVLTQLLPSKPCPLYLHKPHAQLALLVQDYWGVDFEPCFNPSKAQALLCVELNAHSHIFHPGVYGEAALLFQFNQQKKILTRIRVDSTQILKPPESLAICLAHINHIYSHVSHTQLHALLNRLQYKTFPDITDIRQRHGKLTHAAFPLALSYLHFYTDAIFIKENQHIWIYYLGECYHAKPGHPIINTPIPNHR